MIFKHKKQVLWFWIYGILIVLGMPVVQGGEYQRFQNFALDPNFVGGTNQDEFVSKAAKLLGPQVRGNEISFGSAVGMVPPSSFNLGPVFVDRAKILGRNRFSISAFGGHAEFAQYDGIDLGKLFSVSPKEQTIRETTSITTLEHNLKTYQNDFNFTSSPEKFILNSPLGRQLQNALNNTQDQREIDDIQSRIEGYNQRIGDIFEQFDKMEDKNCPKKELGSLARELGYKGDLLACEINREDTDSLKTTFQDTKVVTETVRKTKTVDVPVLYKIIDSDLQIRSESAYINLGWGITDHHDIQFLVPLHYVDWEASVTRVKEDPRGPTITETKKFGETTSGLGDITTRFLWSPKGNSIKDNPFNAVVGAAVRAPTGDEEEFLGRGSWGITPSLILSKEWDSGDSEFRNFGVFGTFGYQFDGDSSEFNRLETKLALNRIISSQITAGLEFIGNFYLESEEEMRILDGAMGVKYRPSGDPRPGDQSSWMIIGAMSTPLNDDGLRADWTATIGLEFLFSGLR